MEHMNTLNNSLKEFPPLNTDQLLPNDAVVEIAYHGQSWKDFLHMQGFDDEQEGDLATLLKICQCIETVEEWSEMTKIPTKNVLVWTKLTLLTRSSSLDISVSIMDPTSPTILRIAIFANLSYNLPIKLAKRNTA